MGTIVITTNVTLDGIVQDPDGQEGFRRGGWFPQFGGQDLEQWAELETAEALGAAALLLGRRSDKWFAARWNGRTGAWADKLNAMPKYVVSSTTEPPEWRNATVLSGDGPAEIAKLKLAVDGEMLRLVVFPVVLGAGDRLFGQLRDRAPLRLAGVRQLGSGLAYLTYEVAR